MLISKSEASYIQSSLLATAPLRGDGRSLLDYRPIAIETGVAPTSNGSSRAVVGGTEVIVGIKLEVEDHFSVGGEGRDGGRIDSVVTW